jgi:hypothetical protein
MRTALRPLSLAFLAAAAPAQTVPPAYAGVEADSRSPLPFANPTRVQFLIDRSIAPGGLLARVAFRGDGGLVHPGVPVDLEISMSESPSGWGTPSNAFATNRGANHRITFRRQVVNLPPLLGSPQPQPFMTPMVMDNPFAFSGQTLLVEFAVYSATGAANYLVDAWTQQQNQLTIQGTRCNAVQLLPVSPSVMPSGNPLEYWVLGGAANANGTALMLIGSRFLATPVPIPFSACLLHQDVLLTAAAAIDGTGMGRFAFPLPANARDMVIVGQAITIDSAFTRISATESCRNVIGGYWPMSMVWSQIGVNSQGGLVQAGLGAVMRF